MTRVGATETGNWYQFVFIVVFLKIKPLLQHQKTLNLLHKILAMILSMQLMNFSRTLKNLAKCHEHYEVRDIMYYSTIILPYRMRLKIFITFTLIIYIFFSFLTVDWRSSLLLASHLLLFFISSFYLSCFSSSHFPYHTLKIFARQQMNYAMNEKLS